MKHVLAAVLLAMAASAARAADTDYYRYGPGSPGRPEKFFVPEYPAEALRKGVTGYVDVEGTVGGLRFLEEPVLHAGTPEAEVFVEPTRDVARFWQFYPSYRANTCFPSRDRVELRVVFEIEGGKPKISIEVPRAPPRGKSIKAANCPEPRYPRAALMADAMANVYSAVHLRPDGKVSSVDTETYPHRGIVDEMFSDAVKSAFEGCEFPPAADPATPRTVCYDVIFRMAR